MGNITFGSFIAEKRKAHKFNLRDTAKHLNIAYGYLCDIEQSRRPAPNGDFVERISAFLNLDKSEHELLLDLAAKSRNTVSADLPDYTTMSVPEMADLLGLKSGTAYDLVKRGYFETTLIDRRIRIITSSFEAWYQKQTHYVKISERSNENGIYREA